MSRSAVAASAVAALVLILPARAGAHITGMRLRAERYLKLDVQRAELRIVFSLQLETMDALRVRQHVDTDHDGALSQAEVDAEMRWWDARLSRDVRVTEGGEPIAFRWGEGAFVPPGEVAPVSTTIELVAHVPLDGGGEHALEVRDAFSFDGLQRTEVRFEHADDVELSRANLAPGAGTERRLDITEAGVRSEPRVFAIVARVPGMPRAERRWLQIGTGAAIALVVTGAVAAAWVRRRRRSAA